MYTPVIIAKITAKESGYTETINIMKMNYKIEENVLWITDHRGSVLDFDLNDHDVKIMTYQ